MREAVRAQAGLEGLCRYNVLARWGGAEFVVLLPNADEGAARTELPFLLNADGEGLRPDLQHRGSYFPAAG